MNSDEVRLLNQTEASQMLGCSPALLRKMRLCKTGPAFCKIGRLVRYALNDLTAFVQAVRKEV